MSRTLQRMKKLYKAKRGAQFTNKKAQVYGQELEKIKDEHNGRITPLEVVIQASDKYNPLHEVFEWNNKKAGDKFRLHQARMLINTIDIEVTYLGEDRRIGAFVNVNLPETGNDDDKRAYISIERALTDRDLRQQTLAIALRELRHWQAKYSQFKEFKSLFFAISKAQLKLQLGFTKQKRKK